MWGMFDKAVAFNQVVGKWNTARVVRMEGMFMFASAFNQDVGTWNTVQVTGLQRMFMSASVFNQDVGKWNTVHVTSTSYMFRSASLFNQDVGKWNTLQVDSMVDMFNSAAVFNQDVGNWNTEQVVDISSMFQKTPVFNRDVGKWSTVQVDSMQDMFESAVVFDQAFGNWNTLHLTSAGGMFENTLVFNQDVGKWNTVWVTEIQEMFSYALVFNQDVGKWSTVHVSNMEGIFQSALVFNQDVSKWSTMKVTSMADVFQDAAVFDHDVGRWNTVKVTYTPELFDSAAAFNQDVGKWDTTQMAFMNSVFTFAAVFNQDVGKWNTAQVTQTNSAFYSANVFNQNVGKWNTARVIMMSGMFAYAAVFAQDVSKWNTMQVTYMMNVFHSAAVFNWDVGKWDTSNVSNMKYMFESAVAFNQDVGKWNTMQVTDMRSVFKSVAVFNQDVGKWNVAQVTGMQSVFQEAAVFNQNVGNWNTVQATSMEGMFYSAALFNQDIGKWNTAKVEDMSSMFYRASRFDQCLDKWKTSQVKPTGMLHMFFGSSWNRCAPCSEAVNKIAWTITSSGLFVAAGVVIAMRSKLGLGRCRKLAKWIWNSLIWKCKCPQYGARFEDLVAWPKVEVSEEPFAIGCEAHHRIGPERWCITRADLDLFENEVYLAWREGKIPNSETFPNPHHDDVTVGPTMYQVNEHFIMPLTAQYGGMSYALLLHPEGLECNVFATHAWAEGVFEFCDKVRRGWPRGCEGMYVCFLSNPQNLDISDFLDAPLEHSPFFVALSIASHMLVVPNRFISIYTRLWCCYEAFVAYNLEKTIVLAPAKIFVSWVRQRLLVCAVAFIFGHASTSFYLKAWVRPDLLLPKREFVGWLESTKSEFVVFVFTFLRNVLFGIFLFMLPLGSIFTFVIRYQRYALAAPRTIACLHGVASAATGMGLSVGLEAFAAVPSLSDFKPELFLMAELVGFVYCLVSVACAILILVQTLRLRTEEARLQESSQLNFDRLIDAGCSNDQDKNKILNALASQESNVELALRTLMSQGMSTAEIRRENMSRMGRGYSDIGSKMFALIFCPSDFCMILTTGGYLEQRVGPRTVVLCMYAGIVFYFICWWATLRCDADLSNLIMRAALVAWCYMLIGGFAAGLWGVAAGVSCAAYYVLRHHKHVQQAQLHQFCEFLKPITILCFAFSSWQAFSTAVLGIGCKCIWYDVAGIFSFSLFWTCVARTLAWLSPDVFGDRAKAGVTVSFLVWTCFHSLVVVANMLLSMNHKFFYADAQIFHKVFIPQRFHFVWGIFFLILACLLAPWEYVHHHRLDKETAHSATETAEVEMQLHWVRSCGSGLDDTER